MDRVTRLALFVASDPNNLLLACDFFDAVLEKGGVSSAGDTVEALRHRHAADAGFLRRLARVDLLAGRFDDAEASYRAVLVGDPNDGAVVHDLAFLTLLRGDVATAESLLGAHREQFSNVPELGVLWARCAYLARDNDEALRRLDALSETSRRLSSALALESLIRWDDVDNDTAIALAERALHASPRESDARLVLASAALVDRDGRRAIEYIAPVVEAQPRHGRALSVFGQALLLLGDQAGGREALLRAVHYMPDHIGTWHVLAWVHLLAGEVDEAHVAYERAYAIDRNFGETHGGLALIHAVRGEREEAQVALRKALRLDPGSSTAQFARLVLESNTAEGLAASTALVGAMRQLPELTDIEPEAVLKSLQARLQKKERAS